MGRSLWPEWNQAFVCFSVMWQQVWIGMRPVVNHYQCHSVFSLQRSDIMLIHQPLSATVWRLGVCSLWSHWKTELPDPTHLSANDSRFALLPIDPRFCISTTGWNLANLTQNMSAPEVVLFDGPGTIRVQVCCTERHWLVKTKLCLLQHVLSNHSDCDSKHWVQYMSFLCVKQIMNI